MSGLRFQYFIEGFVNEAIGTVEVLAYRLDIREGLAGPQKRFLESFRIPPPLADPGNRFRKRPPAGLAVETSLLDLQDHVLPANRLVLDLNHAMVIDRVGFVRTFRADFEPADLIGMKYHDVREFVFDPG
jgi:hypothetical protein